ncbi:L-aspartate oxidase [Tepidanaerobacter acetatoxydans Re1]|uniref:L-aspartate oxidase n=1 Tax=Tepidanaerobacter acetatoxydans (strain DSM 21804 / JCM 16047 / Re1) TaxID=1209989 RepID=F4LUP2_TEPAE|nr:MULTISPECIES: FAD-binding protein [Tepidanaerobacter]AEE90610.1 L-aspartate oxidase [Tepidanaerobacter acetatoxydans Re1]CCP25131.1 L-aspartate oxidase [Tepidanaerobacter acetatoxydans Re1]
MLQIMNIGITDVAVIGGGLAAMYAALEASNYDKSVVIISKKPVGRSGASVISKSVHRFPPDHLKEKLSYKNKIIEAGRYINNRDLVDTFVEHASQKMDNIEKLKVGLNFKEKLIDGKNHKYFAACKPKMGKHLTIPLSNIIKTKDNINIMEGYMAVQIVIERDTVCGILIENKNRLYFLGAKAVVIATGGGGYNYIQTSNTNDLTGDGYAMALRAGLPLIDMEFIQFYPYRTVYPFQHDIFPDIFSHGAKYLNEKGERFMDKYPKKELENRDILSREMFFQKEIYLNIEDCDKDFMKEECDDLYDNYLKYKGEQIKVSPVAHFMMGGVKINADTSTDVRGLFCCGEVAGGLHGANRLAGHALTETVVFGHIAGEESAHYAGSKTKISVNFVKEETANWVPNIGEESPTNIKNILRRNMWESAGIVRNEDDLQRAKDKVEELEQQIKNLKPLKLRDWIECQNMIQTSKMIIDSCILRKESRGAHYRSDFPEEDINWQRNIIIN